MIRKSASWVNIIDERILESLRDHGPASPSIMAVSKGIKGSKGEIKKRCKKLAEEGLITQEGKNSFRITELGKSYLAGNIDLGAPQVDKYIIINFSPEREMDSRLLVVDNYLDKMTSTEDREYIRDRIQRDYLI